MFTLTQRNLFETCKGLMLYLLLLFRVDKFEVYSYERSTKYWKVWMDNLSCNGSESTILACYYDINQQCADGKDVGVWCQPEYTAVSEYEPVCDHSCSFL